MTREQCAAERARILASPSHAESRIGRQLLRYLDAVDAAEAAIVDREARIDQLMKNVGDP